MYRRTLWFLLSFLLIFGSSSSFAQDIIEEYRAYISQRDLHNSYGERLIKPWEIIRQDRANYHKFGLADEDDYYDSFFALEANRAVVERMIRRGRIDQSAGQNIVDGDVYVRVRIYGRRGVGDSVSVTVE